MPAMILSAMSRGNNLVIDDIKDIIIVAIISYTFFIDHGFYHAKDSKR